MWYEVALSDVLNVPYPTCAKTAFARANHLGNADDATIPAPTADESVPSGVNANRFLWQIPSIPTPTSSDYFGSMDQGGGEGRGAGRGAGRGVGRGEGWSEGWGEGWRNDD